MTVAPPTDPGGPLRVLVLGGPPWRDDVNQSATQLARALARHGHEVLYLCRPRQSSWLRGVEGRGRRRLESGPTASGVLVDRLSGLTAALPLTASLLRPVQRELVARAVARAQRRHGPFEITVLYWWFFPELVHRLPGAVLYDAVDEHHAYPVNAGRTAHNRRTLDWEHRTAAAADAVATVSAAALGRLQAANPAAALVPNGFDLDLFARLADDLAAVPVVAGRVGYAGGIGARIDWALVRQLAQARPSYDWVFAGGGQHPADLPGNVRFLGPMGYPDILRETASSTVTIIPFVDDEFTRGSDFMKGYDYLALGKAVVSTPLPSLARLQSRYPGHVHLAGGVAQWLAALDRELTAPDAARPRPDLRPVSTDARAGRLLALLGRTGPGAPPP